MSKVIKPLPHIGYCLECGQPIRGYIDRVVEKNGINTEMMMAVEQDLHVHVMSEAISKGETDGTR